MLQTRRTIQQLISTKQLETAFQKLISLPSNHLDQFTVGKFFSECSKSKTTYPLAKSFYHHLHPSLTSPYRLSTNPYASSSLIKIFMDLGDKETPQFIWNNSTQPTKKHHLTNSLLFFGIKQKRGESSTAFCEQFATSPLARVTK